MEFEDQEQEIEMQQEPFVNMISPYSEGFGIDISEENEISVDTNEIQEKLTAGDNITISDDNVISATSTQTTWGDIQGTLSNQTDLQNALNAKQGVLTAGDNITITNDVISATDTNTTYTAGNAITIDSTDNNRIDAAIYPADFFTADATTSGTGSSITLDNTIPVKLDDVKLDGNTTQQTYTGKNLLPSNGLTVLEQDGITFTPVYNDNNELLYINANGTYLGSNSSIYYPIGRISFISGETYTCSGCDTGSNATYRIWVESSSSIGAFPSGKRLFSSDGPHTETASADENNVRVSIQVFKDKPLDNVKFYPQIELSSGATTYEPYVGGTASPNPDYPQTINVVTGAQTVKVSGKNLIYGSNQTDGGIESVWDNSNVTLSGTTTTNYANITATYSDIYFPAGDYTFSMTHSTNQFRTKIRFRYDDTNHDYAIVKGASSVSFSLPKEARLMRLFIDDFSAGAQLSESFGVQLEQGSTPTSYQLGPQTYTVDLGSIELCKLGDYQDYIYKSGNDWYVHRAIEKVSLDGSTGGYNSSENWYYASFTNLSKPTPLTSGRIISNYFTESDSAYMHSNKTVNGLCAINSNTHIVIRNTNYSDAGSYQTWLGTTTPIFYYALATPTDTQITDNTLIGQLNALYGAQDYDDATIITVSATGTNLPAILEVSAFAKSLEGIIDNAFIDTTYNDFTGTDGNTDGKSGLVPAPTTTDAGKFLKADGTWDTAGSPITVVQTIGTSTTDVMSQDATTNMVFENAKDIRIKIGNGASTHSGGAIAIGRSATASGQNSVAIGAIGNTASGISSLSIGRNGTANRQGSICVGYASQAQGNGSIAIGGYSGDANSAFVQANKHGGIALGMGSQVTEVGEMNIGDRTSTYGYNSSAYRLLSGVYDGQNAHDAATVGQINATIDAINTALSTNIPHIGA